MSRWADAFRAALLRTGAIDSMNSQIGEGAGPTASVVSVNTVTRVGRADVGTPEDRVDTTTGTIAGPVPLPRLDELIERLGSALAMPRPWQRVTDPEKAFDYFKGQAHRLLGPLDPTARGLFVAAEEAKTNPRTYPGGPIR